MMLVGYDWDGVLMSSKGIVADKWSSDLLRRMAAGDECVILTCNTEPENVRRIARDLFPGVAVHRFKRSDVDGKARWLAANKGNRRALLIDDQARYLMACDALGVEYKLA